MNEVKIISLSGNIGAGKNEIAKIAAKQFGYKPLMLAGLTKSVISQVYGVSLEELEDRNKKEKWRPLVIKYAEKMKEVDLYAHCKYVYELIKKDLDNSTNDRFIITDMRWPFESLYFRKFDRCSHHICEMEYEGFRGYQVSYKSLYVESDLVTNTSTDDSESHYDYFKKNSDGIITNGKYERSETKVEREGNSKLVSQLVNFL